MTKKTIKAQSLLWQKPYENLKPIVKALLSEGNKISPPFGQHKPNQDGFYMDRDGWVCDLVSPIDSNVIEGLFNLSATIRFNKYESTISDDKSWCQIRGALSRANLLS